MADLDHLAAIAPAPTVGDPMLSTFPSATDADRVVDQQLSAIVERIRSAELAERCALIRHAFQAAGGGAAGKAAISAMKKPLPAITLAGTFARRANAAWVAPSDLVGIDLDDLQPERLAAAWQALVASAHVALLYHSPSGAGLKGAVRVPAFDGPDPASYATAWRAVGAWLASLGFDNDPAVKDVSRLAFLAHDPEAHLNLEAVPLAMPDAAAAISWAADASCPGPTPDAPRGVRVDGEAIPAGSRNTALTRIAGHLRRGGLSEAEMLPALEAINHLRCQPPMDDGEVATIARSVGRYEPHQVTVAVLENWSAATLGTAEHDPPTIAALCAAKPALRPSLIDGILRLGETMNVIAAPKVGKSWLVTDLALAVATGRPWLGYGTQQRDVLILDNELHGETSANRVPKVAAARGLSLDDYGTRICIENLRGRLTDLFSMAAYFDRIPAGRYGMIVLDAFYRFLPAGSDENDNGTMASLYNAIDRHAERLGCCFALIHHSSKGSQSGKAVTDVGAGAGAQSRATDTHLVLRPHEEEHAVVLDAAVRSWPPLQAQVLRWDFPVWNLAPDLDPSRLKQERPRRDRTGTPAEGEPAAMDAAAFAARFLTSTPQPRSAILAAAMAVGLSQRKATLLLGSAEQAGTAHRWPGAANRPQSFATIAPPSTPAEPG